MHVKSRTLLRTMSGKLLMRNRSKFSKLQPSFIDALSFSRLRFPHWWTDVSKSYSFFMTLVEHLWARRYARARAWWEYQRLAFTYLVDLQLTPKCQNCCPGGGPLPYPYQPTTTTTPSIINPGKLNWTIWRIKRKHVAKHASKRFYYIYQNIVEQNKTFHSSSCISLHCKLVSVRYREYEYGHS